MTIKAILVTSHDFTLVLFQWIIKQDYENKYLVTGDWSQSTSVTAVAFCTFVQQKCFVLRLN